MKYLALIAFLLVGCYVTPEHIEKGELFCAKHGGVARYNASFGFGQVVDPGVLCKNGSEIDLYYFKVEEPKP